MKYRKSIIYLSIIIALVILYQLSFTFKTRSIEKKAKALYTQDGKLDRDLYKHHLDSIGNKQVYNVGIANYTYLECKKQELKLGLDLQGGMSVILEIPEAEILKGYAGFAADNDNFKKALANTQNEVAANGGNFVDIFAKNFKTISPTKTLASIFANSNEGANIKFDSKDAEVITYLKEEINGAIDRAFEVIQARLNESSVSEPTIQKLGSGKLSLELPGVDNPEQIRRMIQESANLEFWETFANTNENKFEAYQIIQKINDAMFKYGIFSERDTTPLDTSLDSAGMAAQIAQRSAQDSVPLFKYMIPQLNQDRNIAAGPVAGVVLKENLTRVQEIFNHPRIKEVIPANLRLATEAKGNKDDASGYYQMYFLKADVDGEPGLSGNIIENARPSQSMTGEMAVSMNMTPEAGNDWKLLTRANINKFVAVVLDGKVYSAPRVNSEISGGNSEISGSFDYNEAKYLSNILKAGRLPARAQIVAEDVVGPTLGEQQIKSGFLALIASFIIVLLFMLAYYNRGGWVAVVAVIANVVIVFGGLATYGAALTLPGLAGLVLTIGMAVDANVLIFERMKEELRSGLSFKQAVINGYKYAFPAILDANVTTFVIGIILFTIGAGPAYGFALILMIGIISSLFTALLLTRVMIDYKLEKDKKLKISFPWSDDFFGSKTYNFIKNRKKFYLISAVVILAGIMAMATGGLKTGIDFKGGWSYVVQFDKGSNATSQGILKKMNVSFKGDDNLVKTLGTDNRFKIITTHRLNEQNIKISEEVQAELITALKEYGMKDANILQSAKVGSTIASGIRNKSISRMIIAIILIFIYILIRFRRIGFSIGAVIALVHDILIVLSAFAILGRFLPFSMEIDQAVIAALLTILGYSINDTVVVFDRVREYINTFRTDKDMPNLINKAINSTLNRTVVTSVTSFIVVLVLFIFGGEGLKSFTFALLIGIIVGTYSSICIATPIVVDLIKEKAEAIVTKK